MFLADSGFSPSAKLHRVINIVPHTFKHIIYNTRLAAIGPLEYCAVARLIKTNRSDGPMYVLLSCLFLVTFFDSFGSVCVCLNSPLIAKTLVNRQNAGIKKIKDGRHKLGARKTAQSRATGRGGWGPAKNKRKSENEPVATGSSELEPSAKRRRLSVDARLSQTYVSSETGNVTAPAAVLLGKRTLRLRLSS